MTTTGARPDAGEQQSHAPVGDGRPPDAVPVDAAAPAGGAATDTAPEGLGATDALPRLFKVFGGIVAPTSLLTGLLFYFGRSRAAGYYRYFHVNSTVLDFSTNDYLFSGVDGLFVPIAVAALLALVVLWANRLLLTRVSAGRRRRAVRLLAPASGLTGAVLVVLAFADLLTEGGVFGSNSATGGLFLAVGVILAVYAVRLVRLTAPAPGQAGGRRAATGLAEWGAAFLLVSIGLFWAADAYAFGVGTGGAITLHRALPTVPEAVLYSQQSLSLDVPGVTEVRCADPDAAYRFRYDGLRLVRQAGNQYLLLPATWDPTTGAAVLIPRSATIRLEFRSAAAPASAC
jgi:hypothetical protein